LETFAIDVGVVAAEDTTKCEEANREFAVISQKDTSQLLLEAWFRCGDVWDKNVKDHLSSSSGDTVPFEIAKRMDYNLVESYVGGKPVVSKIIYHYPLQNCSG